MFVVVITACLPILTPFLTCNYKGKRWLFTTIDLYTDSDVILFFSVSLNGPL